MMAAAAARAAAVLGIAGLLSTLFVFTRGLPEYLDLIDLRVPGAVALGVLGALALVGGVRRSVAIVLAAGLGFLAVAVVQLVGLALTANILGGDASTTALAGGLGIGLLCTAYADRNTPPEPASSAAPKGTPAP